MENRKFTSKMDRPFAIILATVLLFVMFFFVLAFFLDDFSLTDIWVAIGCFLFTLALLLWLTLDITYEFRAQYLFLRAGFLFTKIRYEDIEGYNRTTRKLDALSGFTMLSSTKALEILSPTVMLGCVKISPSDMEGFIVKLERCMQKKHS